MQQLINLLQLLRRVVLQRDFALLLIAGNRRANAERLAAERFQLRQLRRQRMHLLRCFGQRRGDKGNAL